MVFRQLILGTILLAGALAVWIAYFPAASTLLERAGVLGMLGMEPAEAEDAGQDYSRGATQVTVEPVTNQPLYNEVTAIGDGKPLRSVVVRAEATGRVQQVSVASNDLVSEGDTLARLERRAQEIAVERALVMRDDARSDYDRQTQLADRGAATGVAVQEAEIALRTAELELEQARFELSQRDVTAPIDGRVGLIELEVGARVSDGDAIATLTDRSEIRIDFRVPERFVARLEVGQSLQVTPLAQPDRTLEGRVAAIDSTVDRASRTILVEGRIPNDGDRLRGGMAFSVALSFTGDSYPAIDPLSVQWSRDGPYVWVVRDGTAREVPVTLRQRRSDAILVEADLSADDRVITEGLQSLRDGAEVEVVERQDPAMSQRSATGAERQL